MKKANTNRSIQVIAAYSEAKANRCKGIAMLCLSSLFVIAYFLFPIAEQLVIAIFSTALFFFLIGFFLLVKRSDFRYMLAHRDERIYLDDGKTRRLFYARDIACLAQDKVAVGQGADESFGYQTVMILGDGSTVRLPMRNEETWHHLRVKSVFCKLGILIKDT